ncbi:zinc finger, CCHC-type containing protein [Tanacetum coccineum]
MTGAKFDIEKFDRIGDFGLWRIKIRSLLIQYRCEAALEVLPADMEAEARAALNKKAHSAMILYLGNKVLREVTGETTVMEDEDLDLLLLTSVPALYEHFVDTLHYGREALTLEDAMATLNSKKIKERSKAKRMMDHLKRNCPKNNRKKSTSYVKKDDQPSSSGSIYDGSDVMMVMSVEALLDWIMDSGGENKECKIRGIGKMRVQLRDGSSFVLKNVRDNYVYSLDGNAVTCELNASVKEKDSHAQVWRKRLGHISEAGLQVLEKQELSGKKRLDKLDFYENYVLGKSHRVESLGGKRYFLSIVDDYSRRLVKNQTSRTVKKLRTDNGLKFCNWESEQLCIESGIARHLTVVFSYLLQSLNESVMYKDTLKDSGVSNDKSVEELQVEVELQRLNNHTLQEDQTNQEDGNDEDARNQETDQTTNLTDYQLTQDREPRI